jgi:hypothetical protein
MKKLRKTEEERLRNCKKAGNGGIKINKKTRIGKTVQRLEKGKG